MAGGEGGEETAEAELRQRPDHVLSRAWALVVRALDQFGESHGILFEIALRLHTERRMGRETELGDETGDRVGGR